MKERLDKFISSRSTYSRRDVKQMLRDGRITRGGIPLRDPALSVCETDGICMDGVPFSAPAHIYLMLNKPQGVVSASASRGDSTVVDLVPPEWKRDGLFPAGRLDKDTTGFVLLTDDGDFAHRILSPKKHVQKTYRVTLSGPVQPHYAAAFANGICLGDGTRCRSAQLLITDDPCVVRVQLHEGRYHQIKRMFAALGNVVTALHRESIGHLPLDDALAPGECRPISAEELQRILQA